MLAKDVRIGGVYLVSVSGALQRVQLTALSPYGGWVGRNLATGRTVRLRSARRLRREVEVGAAVAHQVARLEGLTRPPEFPMGNAPAKRRASPKCPRCKKRPATPASPTGLCRPCMDREVQAVISAARKGRRVKPAPRSWFPGRSAYYTAPETPSYPVVLPEENPRAKRRPPFHGERLRLEIARTQEMLDYAERKWDFKAARVFRWTLDRLLKRAAKEAQVPSPEFNPRRSQPEDASITYRHRPSDEPILWSNVYMLKAQIISTAQTLLKELRDEGHSRAQVYIIWWSGKVQRVRLPK